MGRPGDTGSGSTEGGSATRRSSWVLATVGIGLVVASTLPAFLTASLAVEIRRDFPLGDSVLGLAVAASFLVATLASAPAGRLVDRIGASAAIHAGAALATAAPLAIALFVDSAATLVGVLTVSGLANAITVPAASVLISRRVRPGRQGIALGVQQAGAPAGALLAGLGLPLIAIPMGWRVAFGVAAIVPVAVVTLMRVLPPAKDSMVRRRRRLQRGLRPVHLLALAAALANGAANGMVAFLVVYAIDQGLAAGGAGILLSAMSFAAGASRIVVGAVADARGGSTLARVAALLVVGAAGYPLLATGQPAAIVAGALVAGGIGWGWAGLMMLAIAESNRHAPGAAMGIGMMGIYAGASLGPVGIGIVVHAVSFTAAWASAAVLALVAAGVVLLAERLQGPAAARRGPAA